MGQFCSYSEHTEIIAPVPEKVIEHENYRITVKITYGDIINENVDAIVVVADQQYNFQSSRLTKQVINLGGRAIQSELMNQYRNHQYIQFGDVFYTHAEELEFDYIFFAILPPQCKVDADRLFLRHMKSFQYVSDDDLDCLSPSEAGNPQDQKQHISQFIHKTLKLGNELGLSSISFPVISYESSISSKCFTALVMLFSIKQYIDEHHLYMQHLNLINITIADRDFIKPFKAAFNRLIRGQKVEVFETPYLGSEQYEPDFTNENEILQFGQNFKDRPDKRLNQRNLDSI